LLANSSDPKGICSNADILILTGFVDEVAGAVALGFLDAGEAVEHSLVTEEG
jgi:hypothetical protein